MIGLRRDGRGGARPDLRRPASTAVVFAIALLVGAALSPSLQGCSDETALGRVAQAFGVDTYALDETGNRELARFNTAYRDLAADPGASGRLKQFSDAYKRVRRAYVHEIGDATLVDAAVSAMATAVEEDQEVTDDALLEAGIDGMMGALDPHSTYLNPDELREAQVATSGEFGGLGIQISQQDDRITIIAPIADTPADRAGLRSGDAITHLDGESIVGVPLFDAVRAMRGPPGTTIRLTIERANQPPFDVPITRAIVTIQSVRSRAIGDVAYVRVASFTDQVADGIEAGLADLRAELGGSAAGLVLDLRNNPGGLFEQALALSDAFLDEGAVVEVRGRQTERDRVFEAEPGDLARHLPIVVLINGGSASASEIVAGALQAHGRAVLMGQRTFGKGSVQTVIPLPQEGAVKLTTALYYGPGGASIQARGVSPDIRLVGADDVAETSPRGREADLPRALPAEAANDAASEVVVVSEADCPPLAPSLVASETTPSTPTQSANEPLTAPSEPPQDMGLACAVAFLQAASPEHFLASVGAQPPL